MGRSTGQSWEEGNWGWSPFHLSWVPGSRESDKLILAALEPRPRPRLRIKGFWGGVSIHSSPATRSSSRPGDGGFRRGLYLPPRIPGYHAGGGGRTGYPPRSPPPSVLCPLTSRRAFDPGASGLPRAGRTGCCAGQGGSGCFREQHSPPELGPSPAPAATCGSVADTRARPAPPRPSPPLPSPPLPSPPSAAAALPPDGPASGAWPGESPPPRRPGRQGRAASARGQPLGNLGGQFHQPCALIVWGCGSFF